MSLVVFQRTSENTKTFHQNLNQSFQEASYRKKAFKPFFCTQLGSVFSVKRED